MAEEHESFATPFHISIVHGDTIINDKDDNATLGIDKGYRVNSLLGLGAVIKYAWGELELNHYTFAPQVRWNCHDGEKNSVVAGFADGFPF